MPEKLTLARLKKFGYSFEISIQPDVALSFRNGIVKDVREVLLAENVFLDARKGTIAPSHLLQKTFATSDPLAVAERILKEGEIQLTEEQRAQQREQAWKKLIHLIHTRAINPATGLPHPPQRIEAALQEARVKLDENKSVEEQFPEALSRLRPLLPLRVEQRIIHVIIPAPYVRRVDHFIKNNSNLLKEEWNSEGNWSIKLEIPAGAAPEFYGKLNSLTRGEATIEHE